VKKILILALGVAAVAAFVGFDVVGASVKGARDSLRASLSSRVPLRTQLAEARASVDAYAENVIRGEVAAENLSEMIEAAEREVRARGDAIERERRHLAALRDSIRQGVVVLTSSGAVGAPAADDRDAVRRARRFEVASTILARREKDLAALRAEREATLQEVAAAKEAQVRLAQEVQVLAAEVESLEARQSVAQTRDACRDASVSCSGYGEAEARIRAIRTAVREQNKRLEHYAMRSAPAADYLEPAPQTALEAIDAVLGPGEAP
jgi:chromosome segregation ATPase